jgi:Asp-tRNA(Asn)/Glu-tRNA(Gln) amidotransferase A subunit family amidase
MGVKDFYHLGLGEAAGAIASGAVSPRGLAEASLARIRATDPVIHAWAHLDPARVLRLAASRAGAPAAPLRGVGIGVKDIIDTPDLPTELGTSLHAGRRPARAAACVDRLEAAGAYVLGKTVTTAFAFLDAGPTRNPWLPSHTPGGSSSGSAAAVAAGQVTAAIGTQTNGSVIRPAAYCGVVGFKPTFGVIDFTGAHVFSGTFDTLGTFTRSVRDAALLGSVLAPPGRVAAQPTALAQPPHLAYLADFPWTTLAPDVDDMLASAAVRLRRAGATVTAVPFPEGWRYAHRVHHTIMLYEGAQRLGELQARERARLSVQTNSALDEGHATSEADYRAALRAREQAIAYFSEWLGPYDAVIAPPATGAALAGLASTGDAGCCTLWSLVGFPAITLPIGFNADGLPLGLQLAAHAGADDSLLRIAAWCEDHLGFGHAIAPVPGAST